MPLLNVKSCVLETKNEAAVNESMTDTLFPEDDFVQSYVLGVDKSAINFALNSNHGNMVPVIIGCVAYRPIFSNTTYITGRIFDVYVVDPEKPGIMLAVNVKQTTTVPIDRLRLSSHFEGATNVKMKRAK